MHKESPQGIRQFGLIGYPLSHSFSKKFFTKKFEEEGLDNCSYELFPIQSVEEVRAILKSNPALEGINVTIPHKQTILALLDRKDELVTRIRACNCIRIRNGKLEGFNTDVIGFERSLAKGLKPNHRSALILGTGGSAKAVEFTLAKLGISYKYVSRKPTTNNLSYEQVTAAIIAKYHLIINTTPLGMHPTTTEAAQIPYEALTSEHYLFDLVYNPEKTLFLKKGEARGAQIKNGYEMLVIQAEESWKIWNE